MAQPNFYNCPHIEFPNRDLVPDCRFIQSQPDVDYRTDAHADIIYRAYSAAIGRWRNAKLFVFAHRDWPYPGVDPGFTDDHAAQANINFSK